MKANELMVGDWVGRVYDDNRIIEDYRQVDWIRSGEIGMRYRKVWSIGCIEPIPLTAEILEKNGFEAIYAPEDYRYDDNMLLTETYDKRGYWWVVGNMYVCQLHYVHELQHALRLCGLNELADNFKI